MVELDREWSNPFDGGAAAYDAWYDTGEGRAVLESELAAIRQLLGPSTALSVEVGLGTGRCASGLGIRVGVDPSVEMLRVAKSRGIGVVRGVGEALPLRSGVFDSYLMVTALEFVGDAPAVMGEAARVIRRGGRALFGFIPREGAWGRSYRAAGGSPFDVARFVVAEELDALAAGAGLRRVGARSTLLEGPEVRSSGAVEEGSVGEAGFAVHAYVRSD